jgi:hypothetical protein
MGTEIGAVLGGIGAAGVFALMWTWRYHDVSPWARAAVALIVVALAALPGIVGDGPERAGPHAGEPSR